MTHKKDSRNNYSAGNSQARRSTPGRGRHYGGNRRKREEEPLPEAANRRLGEIEAAGEPLSIAERISSQGGAGKREAIQDPRKSGDGSIAKLHSLSTDELCETAEKEGVEKAESMNRQKLILNILKQRLKARGLIYGEGTLEILPDGFGFLRSSKFQYQSSPDDIYVSPSQIRKFGLRDGVIVSGQIRPPKENEGYFALLRVDAVNYRDPNSSSSSKRFEDLTPIHPDSRIHLEHDPKEFGTRIIDMFCPIGFGQRGLIVSPPRAGKTMLMQNMAIAIQKNFPNAYVTILLIDERPEEVTDMQRVAAITPQCEIVASTFDESPERHIQVAEMVSEKAKRMVECGLDVIVLMDSITRLARAYNSGAPQTGKTMSGGLDAGAMQAPKSFFGAARKVEEGGSLTIIATALTDTGSRMDDVIYEEFKGTGNLEIVLDRQLAERRILPAIDLSASGTRREDRLLSQEELARIGKVRRILSERNPADALETLLSQLDKNETNTDFLVGLKPEKI